MTRLHSNPAFFKSWYVYPPNEESVDWKDIQKEVTHLYVSHVHRDFDESYLIGCLVKDLMYR